MPDSSSHVSSPYPALSNTSPLSTYLAKVGQTLVPDKAQQQAIEALDKLYHQLVLSSQIQPRSTTQGLYLWGDVGRGKTYLMDLFYGCLPTKGKLRLHFHRFMARVHQELKHYQGQQDPLITIANKLASESYIICFDEFFVADIADAMILAGLFDALFKNGVVLVATSNIPIQRLYENGLARHKFLPCIALLQTHTQVLHLDGEQDHRLHGLSDNLAQLNTSTNIGLNTVLNFKQIFAELSAGASSILCDTELTICHRPLALIRAAQLDTPNALAWFDFYALCDGPRSQLDYIEIASRFSTVMISDVPRLGGKVRNWIKARGTEDGIGDNHATSTGERTVIYSSTDDAARRFISLIDELYDQGVKVYISTEVPLSELYLDGALIFEFRRTFSRLIEMSHKI
ncbi:cell division protein ZapE [Paraglaciecola sp. 25GB23A]|uniref:cell division protein ZapE n=2 Tax=Bacteria TaxID=2 RepID=UPI0032AEDC28